LIQTLKAAVKALLELGDEGRWSRGLPIAA